MATLPTIVEFSGMSQIRWKGFYINCHDKCPANDGRPHVWVSKEDSTACGKCKRITWNRKDERFGPRKGGKRRARKGKR